MIHAKGVDHGFKAWHRAEIVGAVVYVLLAVATVWPVSRTAVMFANRTNLQTVANADCDTLKALLNRFDKQEKEKLKGIEDLKTRVTNSSKKIKDMDSGETWVPYFRHNAGDQITRETKCSDLGATMAEVEQGILDDIRNIPSINDGRRLQDTLNRKWTSKINEIRAVINNYNLFKLGYAKKEIDELAQQVPEKLNVLAADLAANNYIVLEKVVKKNRTRFKIVRPVEPNVYSLGDMKFVSTMDNYLSKLSVGGVIMTIIIHILSLCCYLVAPRSRKLDIKTQKSGGFGRPLE